MECVVPEISVVIPVFNEAPNLRELHARIVSVLEASGRSFEIVAVDDGSKDDSLEILKNIQKNDPRVRVVRLLRNFGQTPALYAGFAHVRGKIIVQLDADLQNPPEEIPKLVMKLEEGFDVVQGWRGERQDPFYRRIPSKILNLIVSRATGVKIRDLGCGLKAFRSEVIQYMCRFTHHSRYVPAEIVWLGVKVGEVQVEHRERAGGESKYGFFSLLRLSFDMITSVTTTPIKMIGLIGWFFAFLGFAMGTIVAYVRIRYGNLNDMGTVTAVFFFVGGVQMVATGFICEYVSRIVVEVQSKPFFVVKEVVE